MDWKLIGYSVSGVSVALLGAAGWPTTPDRWSVLFLISGMLLSVVGMMCRYVSHRREKSAIAFAQDQARQAKLKSGEQTAANQAA